MEGELSGKVIDGQPPIAGEHFIDDALGGRKQSPDFLIGIDAALTIVVGGKADRMPWIL